MSFFTPYDWKNRTGTNLNRRTMTDVDTQESAVYDIDRAEGTVYEKGITFNEDLMEDIEGRIKNAFDALEGILDSAQYLNTLYPIGSIYLSYVHTSPAASIGGTWTEITGGLLLPSDNLPDDMIGNLQRVGQDSVNVTPTGSVTFKAASGYTDVARADVPNHTHSYGDSIKLGEYHRKTLLSSGYGWNRNRSTLEDMLYPTYTNKNTTVSGDTNGHKHEFKGSSKFTGNSIDINLTKPAITVYAWVRTA